MGFDQRAGLREALLTGRLEQALQALAPSLLEPELGDLSERLLTGGAATAS